MRVAHFFKAEGLRGASALWRLGLFLAVFGAAIAGAKAKPPLRYEPLHVRNSCLVDSIHFYDLFLKKFPAAKGGWARVLRWGNEEGDSKIASGHAVTIFSAEGKVWSYDINFGLQPLAVPVEQRE